jgi:2-dehydro-3-deoxy-L-rhamnonate dehydrogenase (NAD+)
VANDTSFLGITGHVAIVTGGGRGIGAALCNALLAQDAIVACLDSDEDALKEYCRQVPAAFRERLLAAPADVTESAAVRSVVDKLAAQFGRIDILVNNAGITQRPALLWETSDEQWDAIFDVDLKGALNMLRAVVPLMIDRHYGRIVNMSSMAGKDGNARSGAYSAAKAGLIGLTKAAGKELALSGILVNAVAPAMIETPLTAAFDQRRREELLARIPMGRLGQPSEVADLVLFLASPRLSFSTGAVYDISGGRATY